MRREQDSELCTYPFEPLLADLPHLGRTLSRYHKASEVTPAFSMINQDKIWTLVRVLTRYHLSEPP